MMRDSDIEKMMDLLAGEEKTPQEITREHPETDPRWKELEAIARMMRQEPAVEPPASSASVSWSVSGPVGRPSGQSSERLSCGPAQQVLTRSGPCGPPFRARSVLSISSWWVFSTPSSAWSS